MVRPLAVAIQMVSVLQKLLHLSAGAGAAPVPAGAVDIAASASRGQCADIY
jgi:hypothetical protein